VQDLAPVKLRARVVGVMSMASALFQVVGPLAIGSLSDAISAISPNALVIAIVGLTLVMGTLAPSCCARPRRRSPASRTSSAEPAPSRLGRL
jgi:hypothetical protein